MDDLIRRSDAIKEIMNKPAWHGSEGSWFHSDDIKNAINNIPAVEPKHGEWIYVTVEEWMKTGRDYGHHCSECDEVNETGKSNYCPACGAKMTDRNISNEMYGQMKRMIKVAPSVTVKPKHGEWIYPSDVSGFGRCENCNALWGKDLIDNIFFIHCPRCGAKMKGADDEHDK